jgi:hypothetical protein
MHLITFHGIIDYMPKTPLQNLKNMVDFADGRIEIMVWGGKMQGVSTDTGAFYDVKSDTWLETSLQSAPEPRSGHSMVLDPAAKEVYVYGGEDQNGIILSNLYKIKP